MKSSLPDNCPRIVRKAVRFAVAASAFAAIAIPYAQAADDAHSRK